MKSSIFLKKFDNCREKENGKEWAALKVKVNYITCNNKKASGLEIYTSILRNHSEDNKIISLLLEIMFLSPSTAMSERIFHNESV